ncbi:MAG: amylo-alpha-1,6-glucosidase [Kiritimatiellia bacterium]
MEQLPESGSFHLRWVADIFRVTLKLDNPVKGHAVFRTNIGKAHVRRKEIIAAKESGEPILARDWYDVPMAEKEPGIYTLSIPLLEVGIFSGKVCFFADESGVPQWPEGDDITIKVEPAHTACANTMYSAFVRQFGAALHNNPGNSEFQDCVSRLDKNAYTVIPPSGTFRDLIRQLDIIMGAERFRILQLLPVHPVPTTYARMGRYGCPFAALDFFSVDPSLAEFDKCATPLDQFHELINAVHSRSGYLYMDLPANHTGWAATIQTHHPEWYKRNRENNEFISPGAWGVVWSDLVALDYREPSLCTYMADVFLFWCRQGVDGFRCDAGYMIPVKTWKFIIARVREEYPDTVFMLEGLGGNVETTEELLSVAHMNWAYSELFQTMDRGAMEWYLPRSIELSERNGPLIHFAETHDNNRLATGGEIFARNRTMLSAMLSHQGAFGIVNGVEWFATEKIDVHGASALNWNADSNQLELISRINRILESHPAFGPDTELRMVKCNKGPFFGVWRKIRSSGTGLLILINLDCNESHNVRWQGGYMNKTHGWDLLSGENVHIHNKAELELGPGAVVCLSADRNDLNLVSITANTGPEPESLTIRRRNAMAMRVALNVRRRFAGQKEEDLDFNADPDTLGQKMLESPETFCTVKDGALPHQTTWIWPHDARRHVMVPSGDHLLVKAPYPFDVTLRAGDTTHSNGRAVPFADNEWGAFIPVKTYSPELDGSSAERRSLTATVYTPDGVEVATSVILVLPQGKDIRVLEKVDGNSVRSDRSIYAVLSNGAGAMAQVRAAWGTIISQYDGLLITNNDAQVPVDKTVFWQRCRAWLQYRGYSQEINVDCLENFRADPAGSFAEWIFRIPCGMGKLSEITFRLEMIPDINCVQLMIRRSAEGDIGLYADDEISIVLRPDIEWRNFHTQTKAFQGPEHTWPEAIETFDSGFNFRPTDDDCLTLECAGGRFTREDEWSYMVSHPLEAERGLEPHGDLFSPGWFEISLHAGESELLTAKRNDPWREDKSRPSPESGQDTDNPSAVEFFSKALDLYIVRRNNLRTVIAGYPWFLDWGRDTLIVLRGLIADGRTEESLAILKEFGSFEKQGTLPNMIRGKDDANRETSDAPLWFCVAVGDLIGILGTDEVLSTDCTGEPLSKVVESIVTNISSGTPNGICMDEKSGLIYSPPHYTWMDTNYPAATPREGYPVEIQALWIASLRLVAEHVNKDWEKLAATARKSLKKYFVHDEGWLIDCLRAESGVPASKALKEDTLRCNQLLAVTLSVLDDKKLEAAILRSCESLLVPGAIRSLDDRRVACDMSVYRDEELLNDPHHPYQPHYLGDEDTRRKPAYHNGTAWSWPFPLYAEAMFRIYGEEARERGLGLLSSAIEYLNTGCLGHLPEIVDGDAPHTARGCGAQAWGISELLRVWKLLK